MGNEPTRTTDRVLAGFITDTISSCDGPVNEHQIVSCQRQENLDVINDLVQQNLQEDTDLRSRFRQIEIGPPGGRRTARSAYSPWAKSWRLRWACSSESLPPCAAAITCGPLPKELRRWSVRKRPTGSAWRCIAGIHDGCSRPFACC